MEADGNTGSGILITVLDHATGKQIDQLTADLEGWDFYVYNPGGYLDYFVVAHHYGHGLGGPSSHDQPWRKVFFRAGYPPIGEPRWIHHVFSDPPDEIETHSGTSAIRWSIHHGNEVPATPDVEAAQLDKLESLLASIHGALTTWLTENEGGSATIDTGRYGLADLAGRGPRFPDLEEFDLGWVCCTCFRVDIRADGDFVIEASLYRESAVPGEYSVDRDMNRQQEPTPFLAGTTIAGADTRHGHGVTVRRRISCPR